MNKSSKTSCVKNLTFQPEFFKGTVLLLSISSKCLMACGPDGGWYDLIDNGQEGIRHFEIVTSDEIPDTQNITGIKNHLDRNSKIAWGGWTPSPEVKKEWQDWLLNVEKKINNSDYLQPFEEHKYEDERAGTRFPTDWKGLGEGIGGVPPPPWSYVPKNIGKPNACNLPPKRGTCTEKLNRWGYNAYENKCIEFVYTGCGKNANHFLTQLECENLCFPPPTNGCANDEKIYQ